MDLDGDGLTDVISGSWPGEIYFFRRLDNGDFASGERLVDTGGNEVNVGAAAAAHAVDWDSDGTLDLIVGTFDGKLHFLPGEVVEPGTPPRFGEARRIGESVELEETTDASPFAADWDQDGRLDLLVSTGAGSVFWLRNEGGEGPLPRLAAPQWVIDKSPMTNFSNRTVLPGEWGHRARICVVDYNGDGLLDILLGDICGSFDGKPNQTESEAAEERRAAELLPQVRQQWAAAYRRYRDEPSDEVRQELLQLKRALDSQQEILAIYRASRQYHGFVWLFERREVKAE